MVICFIAFMRLCERSWFNLAEPRLHDKMIFDTVPYCMAKRTHLLPRERQEIVDNIVKHLIPELRKNVEVLVGEYAITEVEIV